MRQLELPVAYNLVECNEVEDLRTTAIEYALEGAPEGTLIWAANQVNAKGWLGQNWICKPGDLHCSIILRPEFEPKQYPELFLVSAVSLAHALATHLSAMTALGFGWPNDVTIAGHKVASIWIDCDMQASSVWMSITASVNLLSSPQDISLHAISVKDVEGETGLTAAVLLEAYARQFVSQINQWSSHGLEYIVRQWKIRDYGKGKDKTIRLQRGEFFGVQQQVGSSGELELKLPNGTVEIVFLEEYLNHISLQEN